MSESIQYPSTGQFFEKADLGPQASELHLGEVGGVTPRVVGTFTRAADGTAYAAGDHIANTTTAANVVPITFTPARVVGGSGRLTGVRCVIAPASGNLVTANFAFDLLLFRPNTNIPFAAAGYPADNAALAVTAAMMRELVAVFSFLSTGWRSPAGSTTAAGVAGWQAVVSPDGRPVCPFNLADLSPAQTLLGIVQAQGAWTPGNVAQQFDFALDVEGN